MNWFALATALALMFGSMAALGIILPPAASAPWVLLCVFGFGVGCNFLIFAIATWRENR